MRGLILGVNGFLGAPLARSLSARGHEVVGLSRSREPQFPLAGTYVCADRRDAGAVLEVVAKHAVDVVLDVLPMSLADTGALLSSLDGRVRQYVMLSSGDVYRNYELLHRRARGRALSTGLDEDAPLRATRYPYRADDPRPLGDPDRSLDDYDKIPVEAAVRRLGTGWTILRLPMIYGPGDRQRRFRWAIGHMARSSEPLVLPRAWSRWVTTYGYVENVAGAIALTAGNELALNRTFNLAEASPTDHREWARRIAEVMGWRGEIRETDDAADPFARRLSGLDLGVPLRFDSGRIRRELGFVDAVSMTEGLERTVADELDRR